MQSVTVFYQQFETQNFNLILISNEEKYIQGEYFFSLFEILQNQNLDEACKDVNLSPFNPTPVPEIPIQIMKKDNF